MILRQISVVCLQDTVEHDSMHTQFKHFQLPTCKVDVISSDVK